MKKESSKRNKLEEEVTPGPAEYNPNFQLMQVRVGRSISFGYSKRFGERKAVEGRRREEEGGGRRRGEGGEGRGEEEGRGGREEYSYVNSSFFDGPKYR